MCGWVVEEEEEEEEVEEEAVEAEVWKVRECACSWLRGMVCVPGGRVVPDRHTHTHKSTHTHTQCRIHTHTHTHSSPWITINE